MDLITGISTVSTKLKTSLMHACKAGVTQSLMCPAATAAPPPRGTEDRDDEEEADFCFSISKGHEVSQTLGCVGNYFRHAVELSQTGNIIQLFVY